MAPTITRGERDGEGAGTAARAGLKDAELPDEMRRTLRLDHGVLVRAVQGAAAQAGIRAGDLILRLNGTRLKNVAHFNTLIAQYAGKTVALLVRRRPDSLFVPLKLPEKAGQ